MAPKRVAPMSRRVKPRSSPSFFFQAEDGIRDDLVTGVQTCALPIFEPLYVSTSASTTEYPATASSAATLMATVVRPGEPAGPHTAITVPVAGPGGVGSKIGRASCRERV